MNVADWIIIALVLLNVLVAAVQGFFAEAFSLAGLVVGYMVAMWQFQGLSNWLGTFLKNSELADILAFFVIFFAVLTAFSLAGRIVRWMMKKVGLSGFDRFLGGILGLAKGGLMVAIGLMALTAFAPTSQLLAKSQLAPYFLVVGRAAIWAGPATLRARFFQGMDLLHQAPKALTPQPAPHSK
ncbi:MAG TPA: CvpA family protein [Candidatus Sulfotelmatobacter sp.]